MKLITTDIPPRLYEISNQFEEVMCNRAPFFLTEEYQAIVLNAMKEMQGLSLPNFISTLLHGNLIAVELMQLLQPAEAHLSQSRDCFNYALSMSFLFIFLYIYFFNYCTSLLIARYRDFVQEVFRDHPYPR